jgi:hypothetical protein
MIDAPPALDRPLVRPVPVAPSLSELASRAYTAGQIVDGLVVVLLVAVNDHWWRSDDPWPAGVGQACRGCGTNGYLLAIKGRCTHPASQQDIASALLGRGVSR